MSPYGGRGIYDPHSEVNRLVDEMFGNLGRTTGRQQRTQQTQWAPALDVVQNGGDLLIRAELPGVKRENLEITLHERVLIINGERRAEEQREGSGYYVRERRYGPFRRSLMLPHDVEEGQISARFEDGVWRCVYRAGQRSWCPSGSRYRAPAAKAPEARVLRSEAISA